MTASLTALGVGGVLVLLPILPALIGYRALRSRMDGVSALVRAAVIWGVLVLAGTELLSLRHMITRGGVAVWWVSVLAAAALAGRHTRGGGTLPGRSDAPPVSAVLVAAGVLAVTGLLAIVAPPNSTDALTYHLARVAHWIQRESVAPYATSVTRQIFMPPWPEYLILHLQLLAGGSDRLAPAVEWLAFAGTLVLAAGIARRLGADAAGAGLAVVLAATTPTAIIEASSTQTNLVVGFWCAALAWFTLGAPTGSGLATGSWAGGALGLALVSKGTAYVICAPLVALLAYRWYRAQGTAAAVRCTLGAGGIALLIAAPMYARNLRIFHHPLGPAVARADLGNAVHGPGALVSNGMRNAALHLRTPVTAVNRKLTRAVERAHAGLGLNPQDPGTTYPGDTFTVSLLSTYEGRMSNPIHFLLVGAAMLAALTVGGGGRRAYALALLGGALLFCWAFRWQHWHGRLHTPLFLLAAPLAAAVLQPLLRGRRAVALTAFLGAASLPWLLANQMRPIVPLPDSALTYATPSVFAVPRDRQYFGEDVGAVYRRVLDELAASACSELGLVGGEETRVYPLFPFARARGTPLRLYYLDVTNDTRVLEERPPLCALLVAEEQQPGWRPGPPYQHLQRRWSEGRFVLYRATAAGDPAPRRSRVP